MIDWTRLVFNLKITWETPLRTLKYFCYGLIWTINILFEAFYKRIYYAEKYLVLKTSQFGY